MMQMSHQATSLGGAGPDPPQSVVDYAIASPAAAPWVMQEWLWLMFGPITE